ncbi:MAG: peptide chain release factor N(5)-glutamine methyltransferase [Planctomycetes bacterium]|nr:peptide chain release factor N(5)-glutamine methyltransferase [Planctomycetota bacterium]
MAESGAGDGVWTVARLLAWTRGHLERQGVESPRLCAEILLAHAMQCDRIRLYTQHDLVPPETALARFRSAVKDAAAGTPIAYLTGEKEFFSVTFEVTPDVLIPRPETEVLVERTIDLARHGPAAPCSILDLGTGSGCIAISLAKHLRDASVCASDISAAALAVAQRNAARHGLTERITFGVGDLFAPWQGASSGGASRAFDIIVCNPPYIGTSQMESLPANVRDFEPSAALLGGPDGLEVIRRFITAAPGHLRPGGHVLLEVAYDQAVSVRALFNEAVWKEIRVFRDALQHERVVQACCGVAQQTQVA